MRIIKFIEIQAGWKLKDTEKQTATHPRSHDFVAKSRCSYLLKYVTSQNVTSNHVLKSMFSQIDVKVFLLKQDFKLISESIGCLKGLLTSKK